MTATEKDAMMTATPEDWSSLSIGDCVFVVDPGREAKAAKVDAKTADSSVIWIIDDAGARRAFDHREGVNISAVRSHQEGVQQMCAGT